MCTIADKEMHRKYRRRKTAYKVFAVKDGKYYSPFNLFVKECLFSTFWPVCTGYTQGKWYVAEDVYVQYISAGVFHCFAKRRDAESLLSTICERWMERGDIGDELTEMGYAFVVKKVAIRGTVRGGLTAGISATENGLPAITATEMMIL